jgi:hypothetical protein
VFDRNGPVRRPRTRFVAFAVLLGFLGTLSSSQAAVGAPAPSAAGTDATLAPLALSVDTALGRHPISPEIYGMNLADPALVTELRLTANRWGGNATSRYNWRTNTSNTGSDYFYENVVRTPAQSLDRFVTGSLAAGAQPMVTVPMIGWVAKPSPTAHPFLCSYPRSAFPSQDAFDPFDAGCGNGLSAGKELAGAVPTTTSVPAGAAFAQAMVAHLVAAHGDAAHGGVRYYGLDNEPVLWSSTHRDVHPQLLGYDELASRSMSTAAAIKAADPTAKVLGPSDWGWCAYFWSAVDQCGSTPTDHDAHGADLVPWYLRTMKAYADARGGARILDYLDEHYYPQAQGVALATAGDAATQALRLRSTRSLWDPTYVDESWIGTDVKAPPIQLIRRLKGWVAAEYPGTRTAIGEYNFGGLESMNGAVTQAEVLGVFGREGLGLATLWAPPKPNKPGAFTFRMYRNYDGAGSAFGETNVQARSAAQGRLSIYAAERAADGALTVMVVNKSLAAITASTSLHGFVPAPTAARFSYSSANPAAVVRQPALPVSGTGWTATFPASSITLLVLARA